MTNATVKAVLERFEDNGIHYVWLPDDIASAWLTTNGKRAHCCVGSIWFHAPLLSKGEHSYYIILNQSVRQPNALRIGDLVTLVMTVDLTPNQADMPDELAEVLLTDPEADAVFQRLTPGRKRRLMWLVSSVKAMDRRIERALRIADFLRAGQTDVQLIQTTLTRVRH